MSLNQAGCMDDRPPPSLLREMLTKAWRRLTANYPSRTVRMRDRLWEEHLNREEAKNQAKQD